MPSARAEVVTRRTYHRPLDMNDPSKGFESWPQVVNRSIKHQHWLWERAQGPTPANHNELEDLRFLMEERAALLAGRVLWMGGTPKCKQRESSMFNCAFTEVETPSDMVDVFWLLLQGVGVGAKPRPGCLFGFSTPILEIVTIPTSRTEKGGRPTNCESYDWCSDTWTISIGDSAEAWAKAVGKLLASKYYGCKRLVITAEECRPAGSRLDGYGWICHGPSPVLEAFTRICDILNANHGRMLPFGAIHDIINLLGTVLSTRRSAQMMLCDVRDPWSKEFCLFKKGMDANGRSWRGQSNNTVEFWSDPHIGMVESIIDMMVASGGSEPGLRNAQHSIRRAPWCRGTNPCGEILLPNKGFCNLVEINVAHPHFLVEGGGDGTQGFANLLRAIYLLARANYRQTCVNLHDGILQRAWHENNENLRLCGVGITGVASRRDLLPSHFAQLRLAARSGADSMADELRLPRSALVTTLKPSGTLSKVMDCKEGFHESPSRFIMNRINFGPHDPMLPILREAGYTIEPHPVNEGSWLALLPVDYGTEPIEETACQQLDRYRMLMENWCDHNVSCTISYNIDEVNDIKGWLCHIPNWNSFIAASFLPRVNEGTYSYMPQTPISEAEYNAYCANLKPLKFTIEGLMDADEPACATGACPIK